MNPFQQRIDSYLRELKVDTTIERHMTVFDHWQPVIESLNLLSGKEFELKKSQHFFTVKRIK